MSQVPLTRLLSTWSELTAQNSSLVVKEKVRHLPPGRTDRTDPLVGGLRSEAEVQAKL
jgi:hypothetical protein